LEACIARPPAEVAREKAALDELATEVTKTATALETHRKLAAEHTATAGALPALPAEAAAGTDLAALRERAVHAEREAYEELTKTAAVITADNNVRVRSEALQKQITAATAAGAPWEKLNDLIGSNDGKKFRDIAQRRTLEILLRHANAQLDGLSRRYRLERLDGSLNLIVTDNEMAGGGRSVHSLSGGESFLVSLALALGLASLASNRLRVESLFIDEGFGALDTGTLATALDALMRLEAQGRKVGVISHVVEMAEKIPVRIEVKRRRSGASAIEIL